MTATSGELLRQAVLAGARSILCPTFLVGDDLAAGRLVSILRRYSPIERTLYAVYPSRRQLSAKVRTFVEHVAAEIGPQPAWIAVCRGKHCGRHGLSSRKLCPVVSSWDCGRFGTPSAGSAARNRPSQRWRPDRAARSCAPSWGSPLSPRRLTSGQLAILHALRNSDRAFAVGFLLSALERAPDSSSIRRAAQKFPKLTCADPEGFRTLLRFRERDGAGV